jgi:hypothetical protein
MKPDTEGCEPWSAKELDAVDPDIKTIDPYLAFLNCFFDFLNLHLAESLDL